MSFENNFPSIVYHYESNYSDKSKSFNIPPLLPSRDVNDSIKHLSRGWLLAPLPSVCTVSDSHHTSPASPASASPLAKHCNKRTVGKLQILPVQCNHEILAFRKQCQCCIFPCPMSPQITPVIALSSSCH